MNPALPLHSNPVKNLKTRITTVMPRLKEMGKKKVIAAIVAQNPQYNSVEGSALINDVWYLRKADDRLTGIFEAIAATATVVESTKEVVERLLKLFTSDDPYLRFEYRKREFSQYRDALNQLEAEGKIKVHEKNPKTITYVGIK